MDAEAPNEVVNLVCVAVAVSVGVVGFAFAGSEARAPKLGGRHSPRQQVRTEHLALPRPQLANFVNAIVNVPLIVINAGLVSPRVDAVITSLLGSLHQGQVPRIAVLITDIHPDTSEL